MLKKIKPSEFREDTVPNDMEKVISSANRKRSQALQVKSESARTARDVENPGVMFTSYGERQAQSLLWGLNIPVGWNGWL